MVHETLKYLLTWVLGLTTSGLGVLCTVLVKRIKAQRKGLLALLHVPVLILLIQCVPVQVILELLPVQHLLHGILHAFAVCPA